MNPPKIDRVALDQALGTRSDQLEAAVSDLRRREKALIFLALGSGVLLVLLLGAWVDDLFGALDVPFVLAALLALVVFVKLRERATAARSRESYRLESVRRRRERLADRWAFGQSNGLEYRDPEHPFAADLDVFGPGSVFEQMNACETILGRDALARWLANEPSSGTVEDRQAAIVELRDDPAFREDLDVGLREMLAGQPGDKDWQAKCELKTRELLDWGNSPSMPLPGAGAVAFRLVLSVVTVTVITCQLWLGWPWIVSLIAYLACLYFHNQTPGVDELMASFERVERTLGAWARVMERVSTGGHSALILAQLEGTLSRGVGAPRAIRQLKRRADRLSWRRNIFWALTGDAVLQFDFHAARSLLRWKEAHGTELRSWFTATAEVEALSAMGTWAEAQAGGVYADVSKEGPAFLATELAHPLLPRDSRSRNDITVLDEGSVWIVTGSNMSGKSTFLRTVGLAAVLGQRGLPVPATSLRLRPLDVVTCMRVNDSLAKGSSLFHAEVTRLKECTTRAEQGTRLLVLLDEILSGTNSRERHIGAAAILRSLAKRGTVSLVSTHDLGLTSIADELGARATVVHFRDSVTDGRMTFDYLLRPGPVPSTNALRVMRSVGLDVPDE